MLRDNINKGTGSGSSVPIQQDSNGILQSYDTTRSMWLSVTRQFYSFGINRKHISGVRWLQMPGGVLSNLSGFLVPRDGIITAISITTNDFTNSEFYIQKNISSNLYTSVFVGEKDKVFDNLNININKQDKLSCYVKVVSGYLYYPEVILEIAWR